MLAVALTSMGKSRFLDEVDRNSLWNMKFGDEKETFQQDVGAFYNPREVVKTLYSLLSRRFSPSPLSALC